MKMHCKMVVQKCEKLPHTRHQQPAHTLIVSNAMREGNERIVSTKHWNNKQFYAANCFFSNRLHYNRVCDARVRHVKYSALTFHFFMHGVARQRGTVRCHALRFIYASRSICNTERTALHFFLPFKCNHKFTEC